MEAYHYVDIFATKGVEYIVVISFLLMLVPSWIAFKKPIKNAMRYSNASLSAIPRWFSFREDRYYHQGHAWAQPVGHNIVRIGIDDFAQKLLGAPQAVHLPQIGEKLSQGDKGWQLIVDSKRIDMLSPVNGKVVQVNNKVLDSPEIVKIDPYEAGWLLEVEAPKARADLNNLLNGNMAKNWMNETVSLLRAKMSGEIGLAMQDGGVPIDGFAKGLSPDHWEDAAAEFFLTK